MQRTGVVTVVIIEEKTHKWFSTTMRVKYVQMPLAISLTADYKSISPEGGTKKKGLQRWLYQHLRLCFHRPKGDKTKRNGSAKHPPLTFKHCTNISAFASTTQKRTEPREMAVQNIHHLLSCTGPRSGHAPTYSKTSTTYFHALAQEVATHQPTVKHQPPTSMHSPKKWPRIKLQ